MKHKTFFLLAALLLAACGSREVATPFSSSHTPVPPTPAAPVTFSTSPSDGEFLWVTLFTETPGASIRYTTDGSEPTSSHGILYKGPFEITETATVRAIAYGGGLLPSEVTSRAFTVPLFPLEPPSLSVPGGPYLRPLVVELQSAQGAEVRYTLDGSAPSSASGLRYDGPITLQENTTLKAIAVGRGYLDSGVAEAAFMLFGQRLEVEEAMALSGQDVREIVDTHLVVRSDILLSDEARLIVRDSFIDHKKEFTFQYELKATGNSRVSVEDSAVGNQCTGSLNWNFFDFASLAASRITQVDCNIWAFFTNDASAAVEDWPGFGATFCDRAQGDISRSTNMEIELCFPNGSVVDESLPLEVSQFVFPNENDSGVEFGVRITDSTLEGWGIGLPPQSDITIRDAPGVTVSVIVGLPWENQRVVLEDLGTKHYQDQVWNVVDSTLRFLNVTTYGWEPNVFHNNILVIRNSSYSASGNNSGTAHYLIEDTTVGLLRAAERVTMEVRNSTIIQQVIAAESSHIVLVNSVVGVDGEEGKVVALGNGRITLVNTTVNGPIVVQDNGQVFIK